MASPVAPLSGRAFVVNPDSTAGAKEYVPVNAEHERLIALGHASAENGVAVQGLFGASSKRRVRFNCTYDVTAPNGTVTQVRAGHERVFDPAKESLADRACEGIRYRNATFEEEVLAMGPRSSGHAYPKFLGWGSFPANRLQPELPRSFGVPVRGK